MTGLIGLRDRLLRWFDDHRRDLPWRAAPGEAPDPYRVWLSEVMLQQTRVETVKPYFERWLERFPTLEALAEAPEDDVLKAWEGLGYYSRARNLHRAVREVVARYGSHVPSDPGELRELPGIGRYTAGAIASIAFGRPEPVVDGNVRRVLARLLDDAEPTDARLWALAAELASCERPGDINQSLMELGAIVCAPRTPRCGECPLTGDCRAYARGTQTQRPARRRRPEVRQERHAVAVVRDDDRLLIVRRPANGRLGGMWEFPGLELAEGEAEDEGAKRAVRSLAGLEVSVGTRLGQVRHQFTHVTVTYAVFETSLAGPGALRRPPGTGAWVTVSQISSYALPAAQHRILSLAIASRCGTDSRAPRTSA